MTSVPANSSVALDGTDGLDGVGDGIDDNKAEFGLVAGFKARQETIQPLVVVACSMAAGIVMNRVVASSITWWWILSVGGWAGWWMARRKRFDRCAAVLLLISVFALAAAWHHWCWNLFSVDDLGWVAREAGQPVVIEAVALNGPRSVPARPSNPLQAVSQGEETRIKLRIFSVRDGARWRPASGRGQLFVDGQLPGVNAGDKIRVCAQLLRPRPAQNPGEFDFWSHQRADRILCRLYANYPGCVTVVSKQHTRGIVTMIETLRSHCNKILWTKLRHERRGLAAAVLLGAREQLDPEKIDDFVVTGTIHLFAISGLHVGMMATGLFALMRLGLLPKILSLVLVVVCVVLYALLTDARPPVVRAALLVSLLCWSISIRRPSSPFNSLSAAAILVLIINPTDLFRTGVQLSFLAVVTLYWCAPWWNRPRSVDPIQQLLDATRPRVLVWNRRQLRCFAGWAGTTATIWLVTLPLVMDRFHVFSPAAVALNLVLWIPMSLSLFSGFGLLLSGWLFPWVGNVCAWVCDANLWLLEATVRSARNVPGSHLWVPGPATWWLWGFYGGLGWLALVPRSRPSLRWSAAILSLWIGIGFLPTWWETLRTRNAMDCTFISVGHGTSVALELPGGETVLYDAGTLGVPNAGTRSISSCLWSQGVCHLDAVILSHADIDHYNALPELLERFDVGVVYCSPLMFHKVDPALDRLRRTIHTTGTRVGHLQAGDRLKASGGVKIEVLHPPAAGVGGSDNANSIVLEISYQGRNVLLPGDLETPGLEAVTAELPRGFDLVMAPHHGSVHSDPETFAMWSQPEWVVISSGHGHDIGLVTEIYQEKGGKVFNTVDSGAIRATIMENRLTVRQWRRQPW